MQGHYSQYQAKEEENPLHSQKVQVGASFEDKNPGESIRTETQVTNNFVTTLLCQDFGMSSQVEPARKETTGSQGKRQCR